jgi:lipoprotein-releasing system permease protein
VSSSRARGTLAALVALALLGASAGCGALLLTPALFDPARRALATGLGAGAALGLGVVALTGLALAALSARERRGTGGRVRTLVLGLAGAASSLGWLALGAVLALASERLPAGAPLSFDELLLLAPEPHRSALSVSTGVAVLASAVGLVAANAAWFLIRAQVRARIFVLVDVLLVAATIAAVALVPLPGADAGSADLALPTARLAITFALLIRCFLRLLPWALDLIEKLDFRAIVAARHLRAKKSGFLAAISFLSILAVSVSSCALTTTLSVMGGFRQDLQRKILGNNAHIVIDRPDAKVDGVDALMDHVRAVDGVRGVSPYLAGEVMVSSASNLSGAVLRGIDLDHVGEVSELPRNVRSGSLDYLRDPGKLTRGVTPSSPSLPPKVQKLDDAAGAPAGSVGRLSEDLDRMLEESGVLAGAKPPVRPRVRSDEPRSELPGIVVGQELARSLRLYVGDEVNIVTPLGDLGPTGPMPKSRPFRVAAIFYSGMYEYDMKFVYVTLATAARFLGAGESVSGVEITVREPERAPEVAEQIAKDPLARPLRVRAWQELNKNLFGALALEKLAMFIALGVAILVASFCIVGTLTLMVQEKGREVAVLKAMGARDGAIVGIFVLEGTLIGVLGAVLGLALGYGMCFAAEHVGIRLNPEVYYIDRLPVHVDPAEFLTVGIAAVFVCLLVTIYPAKLASRLRPVDALRYE